MNEPVRIQRKRTKGWRMQDASPNGLPVVYVGRPSKWGNSFSVEDCIRRRYANTEVEAKRVCVEAYRCRLDFDDTPDPSELRRKNLACWCPLDQPCHADVLLELANKGDSK